jgi:hypothetical protein
MVSRTEDMLIALAGGLLALGGIAAGVVAVVQAWRSRRIRREGLPVLATVVGKRYDRSPGGGGDGYGVAPHNDFWVTLRWVGADGAPVQVEREVDEARHDAVARGDEVAVLYLPPRPGSVSTAVESCFADAQPEPGVLGCWLSAAFLMLLGGGLLAWGLSQMAR